MSSDVQIFPDDQRLDGAKFESLQRVLNAKTVFARVLADLVKVLLDQLLFLNELDVRERFCSKFNRLVSSPRVRECRFGGRNRIPDLVKAVFASVAHIDHFDNLGG